MKHPLDKFLSAAARGIADKEDKRIITELKTCVSGFCMEGTEEEKPPKRVVKYAGTDMKEIIGEQVTSLRISGNQETLVIGTTTKNHCYEAYGDCCSETWFADILGVSELLKAKVLGVKKIPLKTLRNYNTEDGRGRQDYDRVYGYRIKTTRGSCDIIFRNSSNGYYGGDINYVTGRDPSDFNDFLMIKEDWSA